MPRAASALPVGILGGEPLVVVVVAVEHELGAARVQRVPQRADRAVVPVLATAEPRLMEQRQRAAGVARGEVLTEPPPCSEPSLQR